MALKMREGAMSKKMQAVSKSLKRQVNRGSLEPPEGTQPCIEFNQWDLFQTSDFQSCKKINLCYFMSLSFW